MAYRNKSSDISNWYNGGSNMSVQPRDQITAPHLSQIPGLGADTQDASSTSGSCHGSVRDSDSDYVKLAKRGGQSDLLQSGAGARSATDAPAKRHSSAAHQPVSWYYDNAQAGSRHGAPASVLSPERDAREFGPDSTYNSRMVAGSGRDHPADNRLREHDNLPNCVDTELDGNYGYLSGKYPDSRYMDDDERLGRRPDGDDVGRQMGYDTSGYNDAAYLPGDEGSGRVYSRTSDRMAGAANNYSEYGRQQPSDARTRDAPPYDVSSQFGSERLGSGYSSYSRSDYGQPEQRMADNRNNSSNIPAGVPSVLDVDKSHRYVNRMVRENSSKSDMSTLLSFGYMGDGNDGGTNTEKQHGASGSSSYISQYQSAQSPDKLKENSALYRRASGDTTSSPTDTQLSRGNKSDFSVRKTAVDNRPDFFRLGARQEEQADVRSKEPAMSRQSQLSVDGTTPPVIGRPPQFGRRKASAELRPEFLTTETAPYEPSQVSGVGQAHGRMRPQSQTRPDFFNIGSEGQNPVNELEPAAHRTDDLAVLDKVSGYSSEPRSNFHRKKTDPNLGIWAASPVKSAAK